MEIKLNGEVGWLEVFPAIIKNGKKLIGFQLIFKNITERKRAEKEMKMRLLKFNLEDGNLYITKEPIPIKAMEAFKDLLNVGYTGLAIARSPENEFKKLLNSNNNDFDFLWFAERKTKNSVTPNLKDLEIKIEKLFTNYQSKYVIIITGIDYLGFKNGYKNTLAFIQSLKEIAYLTNNIIIISIDPATFNNRELRLFELEGQDIKIKDSNKKLPDAHLKLLKYVYENNAIGNKPSFTIIGQELGLSKPTVRKQIRQLIKLGYMMENSKGRNKVVELTTMGRDFVF
jgi:DNA-binding MarR family transcriptional regulator